MGFTGNIMGYLTSNMIVGFVCGLNIEYAFKMNVCFKGLLRGKLIINYIIDLGLAYSQYHMRHCHNSGNSGQGLN